MSVPDLHVHIYIQIFSPKNNWFSPIKNTFQNVFDFCLPLFYATLQCGPWNIFKIFWINFLSIKTLKKKLASKVVHNRPYYFISQSSPADHSPQPRINFSYIMKSQTRHLFSYLWGRKTNFLPFDFTAH